MKNLDLHFNLPRAWAARRQRSSSGARKRTAPVVLFALFERGRPTKSLKRALAFSRVLQAELHVLRVLPVLGRLDLEASRRENSSGTMDRTLRAIGDTRSWLRQVLGQDEAAVTQVIAAPGDFLDQVAHQAKKVSAMFIVVPAREACIGATATSLACKANVPVLVARATAREDTIVAATDLETPDYPVLRIGAALGRKLDAPLVTFHNLMPRRSMFGLHTSWSPDAPFTDGRQSGRLAEISAKLHAQALAVVRRETDSAAAILGEAREREADLVVVGARRRRWLDRLQLESVAAQVVDRAAQSVLVTPVGQS